MINFNIGNNVNDGTGDTLREAFNGVNLNFTYIENTLNSKQNTINNPIRGTGTTNKFTKFISPTEIGNSGLVEVNGNIGIGSATVPGELFHLGDGNMLLEGGGEVAQKFKRDFTTTGENLGVPTGSGVSINPIFQIGRIIQAGDGDPEIRFMYSDDYAYERTVFEVDRKGIAASVKTSIGSHFEGFTSLTDVNPRFRLNSYPRMRLEMGPGGDGITDVAVERGVDGSLVFFTDNLNRGYFNSTGLFVNGQIYATGDVVAFSDSSVKENIKPIENVIEKIKKSRGVVYDRIDTGSKSNIGFIAQELEQQFPELVITNDDGTKAVKYQNAVAVLFEAIKEQQKQIDFIVKKINLK